jgi:hypothetical protein
VAVPTNPQYALVERLRRTALPIIEGAIGAPLQNAGAPVAGTNEVQTLTIGGTPTAGTFKLVYDGFTTAAITWTATDATLLASINTALDALPNGAASAIVATAGTLSSGIGTVTLTFSGAPLAKRAVPLMTYVNSLTGTSPTLAIAETTPGVDVTGRGAAKGALLTDITNGILYINTGTAAAPTWTKVGTQS